MHIFCLDLALAQNYSKGLVDVLLFLPVLVVVRDTKVA